MKLLMRLALNKHIHPLPATPGITPGLSPTLLPIKLHRFTARSRSHFSWQKQGVAAQALAGSPQIYAGVTESGA